jgi:soluble lytic murein transglycosylase
MRIGRIVSLALAAFLGAWILASREGWARGSEPPTPLAVVLERYQQGEESWALEELGAMVRQDPKGRVGDQAALALGNLLISRRREDLAVAALERAARGSVAPEYARVLLARAVLGAGNRKLVAAAVKDLRLMLAPEDAPGASSPVVRERATALFVQLLREDEKWGASSSAGESYLRLWPTGREADNVRWWTADSHRRAGNTRAALTLLESIWYETPASAWAKQAREALEGAEFSRVTGHRELTGDERLAFIERLRAAALHEEALREIDVYLGQPGASRRGEALLARSASSYVLRRAKESVGAARELRNSQPYSPHTAPAALYAIRSLGREKKEAEVREWVAWVHDSFPDRPEAAEALYNLGVLLLGLRREDEGRSVLERLMAEAPASAHSPDAMWHLGWSLRRSGRTMQAAAAFQRLLNSYPKSEFRKAALYWAARLTEREDPQNAKVLYRRELQEFPNDYYGHLALERLSALGERAPLPGHGKPLPPADRLDDPNRRSDVEGYALVVNLAQLGLYDFAAGEIERFPRMAQDDALQFGLARLLARNGDNMRAIAILERRFRSSVVGGSPRSAEDGQVPLEFWQVLYPYNDRSLIEAALRDAQTTSGVRPQLIAALIRAESLWNASAVSRSGAIGLMQLMPTTAQVVAAARGLPPPGKADLFDRETNIRHGVAFFATLLEAFNGDEVAAVCAYNAGQSAVKTWWANAPPDQSADERVEAIPFVETRTFVKRVLAGYRSYAEIYP